MCSVCVRCWPVLHVALSAFQLNPTDCTKPTHGGGRGSPVGWLSALVLSFLQLHEGVTTMHHSVAASSVKKKRLLFTLRSLSLSLQTGSRVREERASSNEESDGSS